MTAAAEFIARTRPGFTPRIGIVLGSGMGPMADDVEGATTLSYEELPGFPKPGVLGHAGRLVLGDIRSIPVAVMQGRAHYYEHGRVDTMKAAINTLKAIGCEVLILTNAAGSLDKAMPPGSVMMISDHINLVQASPLYGETGTARFMDMVGAYDPELLSSGRVAATTCGIDLYEGVYLWFSGPQFETPAEVRMAALLGGRAIGMSTVPDAILGRYYGLRIAAFSIITNLGAGLGTEVLSHEHTMQTASLAASQLRRLLAQLIADIGGL